MAEAGTFGAARRGMGPAQYDVFISYSSRNKAAADTVCAVLEHNGIRCWIAPRDILPGADWGASIVRAIGASRAFVLIFSESANTSLQVQREVNRAAHNEVPIIPFRIEHVAPSEALEYYLSTPHWLDALTPPLEQHAERLASTITRLLGGEPAATEPPPGPPEPQPYASPVSPRAVDALPGTFLSRHWRLLSAGLAAVAVICAIAVFSSRRTTIPYVPPEPALPAADQTPWSDCANESNPDAALPACTALIVSEGMTEDNYALAYLNRGKAHEEKEDYDLAISDYDEAIRRKPDYSDAFLNRGDAYQSKSQYERAIQDYDQAIRLTPDDAGAYNARGNSYDAKGDHDRAIEDYSEAIRLKPEDPAAYYNRGLTYDGKGDYDRAIEDYNQAIRLKPDDADAYENRGNAYDDKGDHDRAIEDFGEAIRLAPDDADGYLDRGGAYEAKGDHDRAIKDFDKAISLGPQNAEAYNDRGFSYEAKGDRDHAIEDYTAAIRLKPDYALAYLQRGNAYYAKASYGLALEDYNSAIRLQPGLANAYNNRGSVYYIKADRVDAIKDFNEAIRLEPGFGMAYQNRAVVERALGNTAAADADEAKARSLGYVVPK